MATLTSNGSFSSLSISGSGTKSGNITFTPPTLPDGATIISTLLTANLNISMTSPSVGFVCGQGNKNKLTLYKKSVNNPKIEV